MEKPSGIPVVPAAPVAHKVNERGRSELEGKDRSLVAPFRTMADARRQPRFKLEIDITINSRTCGVLKGRGVDISESGIAAMLPIEAPVGEVVELNFQLPCGPVTVRAIVRQKNAFRYGFEFVDSDSVHESLRRTCRDLAVDQSLTLAYF
jgi:hypothetical protein